MSRTPNKITGPNAGGPRQFPIRTPLAARVGQFWRWAASRKVMKRIVLAVTVIILATFLPTLIGATFDLKVTRLGGGRVLVLATNIPGGIRGFCVFETSSNLVTWTRVATNGVNKTWSTNAFLTTNRMTFYRAWAY